MLLEYNIYDNFNPNFMERDLIPGNQTLVYGYPKPRARGAIMDYELWQTGFEYTSSGTLTTEAKVGDILEVLTNLESSSYPVSNIEVPSKVSIWYVVTAIDENNKVTLKNYYWYLIEGSSNATRFLPNKADDTFHFMLWNKTQGKQVMHWGTITNDDIFDYPIKYNLKADTVEYTDLSKSLFSKIQMEPQAISVKHSIKEAGNRLMMCLMANERNRTRQSTRIDIVQNPTIETVVTTERSNYNYVRVIYKDAATGWVMTPDTKDYTINDSGQLVDLSTYTGNGNDLPEQRVLKTMYFEDSDKPTNAELLSEVRGDSIIHKIYFNQNKLRPLRVNQLVDLWYEGTLYKGHISDRCLTPLNDRLTFIESGGDQ